MNGRPELHVGPGPIRRDRNVTVNPEDAFTEHDDAVWRVVKAVAIIAGVILIVGAFLGL